MTHAGQLYFSRERIKEVSLKIVDNSVLSVCKQTNKILSSSLNQTKTHMLITEMWCNKSHESKQNPAVDSWCRQALQNGHSLPTKGCRRCTRSRASSTGAQHVDVKTRLLMRCTQGWCCQFNCCELSLQKQLFLLIFISNAISNHTWGIFSIFRISWQKKSQVLLTFQQRGKEKRKAKITATCKTTDN